MAAILGTKWSTNKKVDTKVAFGSMVERKLFPIHSNPTRMGIEQGLRGDPQYAPGCYGDDPLNTFLSPMNHRPRSIKGYGFGATRAKRPSLGLRGSYPGPADYQPNASCSAESTPAYKPFESAQSRFRARLKTYDHLGPGSHDHQVSTNRRIHFEESFGGPKLLKKAIVTKCTKGISDKCAQCKEVPVGDYYESKTHQLCRNCYSQLREAKGEEALKGMRKVRDCSSIHKHDFPGRQPKTLVMSEKDQKKLQFREAYMSLYYS